MALGGATVVALGLGWALLPSSPSPPSVTVAIPVADQDATAKIARPNPALIEDSADGPLPMIGADGRLPREAYARAADLRDDRPRIALIVTGLGLSEEASAAAIAGLPADVSLAIDPYAEAPEAVADVAREAGHELFLVLPLETRDFPFEDPGPLALSSGLSPVDARQRLRAVMATATGYVGLVSISDGRLESDPAAIAPVLETVRDHGLMYVDGRWKPGDPAPALADRLGLARAAGDLWLDDAPTPQAIDAALAALEERARERAVAIGLARLYPVTIERIQRWAETLEARGFVLTPASAVAGRQFLEEP